jgi:hypothetical protein
MTIASWYMAIVVANGDHQQAGVLDDIEAAAEELAQAIEGMGLDVHGKPDEKGRRKSPAARNFTPKRFSKFSTCYFTIAFSSPFL